MPPSVHVTTRVRRPGRARLAGLAIVVLACSTTTPTRAQTPREPDYDATAAAEDVDTLLTDRGRGYLDARARLESHPGPAVSALRSRIDGGQLDPAQERRLHSVLANLAGPELAPEHARILREALLAKEGPEPWVSLLAQSEPGRRQLTRLVGDRALAVDQRAALLEQLVAHTDAPAELLALVGRGHPALADQLWRSLVARGHRDAASADALRTAIDASLVEATAQPAEAGPPLALAKLVSLRAELAGPSDPRIVDTLGGLARSEAQPFVVRFAALRGLGVVAAADGTLEQLARAHLQAHDEAGRQRDELLAWQAMLALGEHDPERAGAIADTFDLRHEPSPRLAALGWRYGSIPAGDDWIDEALADPWPRVAAAGLRRIDGPCERGRVRRLATLAGPGSEGGADSALVGRAAITALGRCAAAGADRRALHALRALLDEGGIPVELRATAAGELVAHDPEGPTVVARALEGAQMGALAEHLADALRRGAADGASADPAVVQALCGAIERHPNAARAARAALDELAPGEPCP